MLAAIDIGNTKTLIGVFREKKIIAYIKFSTASITRPNFKACLKSNLKKNKIALQEITGMVVSTVVPKVRPALNRTLAALSLPNPLYVSPRLKLGLRLGYKKPSQLGPDRIANAVAAFHLYNGPIIIVDYGTAITICLVTKGGYYKGGIILPGLEMTAWALKQKTALLPYLSSLKRPKNLIGRETKESILSGLAYGTTEMVDGLIERMKKEIKTHVKVIATGGAAPFLFPYSRQLDKLDPDLTLKGLGIIYETNRKGLRTEHLFF